MKTLRILVVEDDPMLGELLAEMLQTMGHEVCGVENTEADAVTAAFRTQTRFDDHRCMAARWKRRLRSRENMRCRLYPSLFFSGDISRIKALRPGAVAVQKPFREADLVHAIQRALKGSG